MKPANGMEKFKGNSPTLDPSNQKAVDVLKNPAETRRSSDARATAGISREGEQRRREEPEEEEEGDDGAMRIQNNLKKRELQKN
jgi:hypothetical protein